MARPRSAALHASYQMTSTAPASPMLAMARSLVTSGAPRLIAVAVISRSQGSRSEANSAESK